MVGLGRRVFSGSIAGVGLLVASACGSGDGPPPPPPATSSCTDIDYAAYATAAIVSFKDDVMPIFGGACTASGCHRSDKKAGLYLGLKCKTDPKTRVCTFPATANESGDSGPLTQALLDEVYANLMGPSTTAPAAMRVVKGDPEHSFIVQKCAGTQNDQGYECKNQDTTHSQTKLPCGDSMPAGSSALCEGTSRVARFDKLAAWIAQGADEN